MFRFVIADKTASKPPFSTICLSLSAEKEKESVSVKVRLYVKVRARSMRATCVELNKIQNFRAFHISVNPTTTAIVGLAKFGLYYYYQHLISDIKCGALRTIINTQIINSQAGFLLYCFTGRVFVHEGHHQVHPVTFDDPVPVSTVQGTHAAW